MRTKPCWSDSLGLEIAVTWFLALLVMGGIWLAGSCVYPSPAHAGDFYLDMGAGATQFTCTVCRDDGTWIQRGLPHQMDLTSFAYRVGVGYRIDPTWSIQAHYLNMGSAKIDTDAVADSSYDPVAHQCIENCDMAARFYTRDRMEGAELSITRHFKLGPAEPFLRVGGAAMHHQLEAWSATRTDEAIIKMHGWVPMALIGGGACYHWACVETTYYRGFGGNTDWTAGLPISKEALVTLFAVKIPLGG